MTEKSLLSRFTARFRSGVKRCCAYLAGKTLGKQSFPLLGVPSGLTEGTREGSLHFLYQAATLPLQPPKTIDPEIFWTYLERGTYIAPQGILRLPKAIATESGGNLSHQGKLVTTFLYTVDGKLPQQHDLHRFSSKNFFPTLFKSDEPVATLTAGWQRAFYHWVYEILPRFHLLEKAGVKPKKFYIDTTLPFQRESLALMGIDPSQIISAETYRGVKAAELIVPSTPLLPTDWGCRYLRETFLPRLSPKKPLRLYVSRSDATRRRILNEEEVFGLLEKRFGFVRAQLSPLNFKEQAELFQAAQVVVGPHGAGFSHLVFCQPGTPFLEIFSPAYFNPCYWQLSERVGLSYHYLFGEGERYPPGARFHLDPDITVDLKKLEASIALMEVQ